MLLCDSSLEQLYLFFSCLNLGLVPVLIHSKTPQVLINDYFFDLDASYIFTSAPELTDSSNVSSSLNLNPNLNFILLTSGSSGKAKFVLLTLNNMIASAKVVSKVLNFNKNNIWFNCLPLHHVGGLSIVFRCIVTGASMLLDKFSLASFSNLSYTHISIVKSMAYELFKNEITPPVSLQVFLCGGSPFSNDEINFFKNKKFPIFLSYGCTEFGSQIACSFLYRSSNLSLNFLDHVHFKINNRNELLIKGDALFLGYWHKKTGSYVLELDNDDYFNTKDIVYIDQNKIIDIKSPENRSISGGENLNLNQIKAVLYKFKGVKNVHVSTIDHLKYGKRPIAYLDINGPFPGDEKLRNYCKKNLPPYACPDFFLPFSSIQ